jgi:hypothetical protein
MAATDQSSIRAESPCQHGAVHTWHISEDLVVASESQLMGAKADSMRTSLRGPFVTDNGSPTHSMDKIADSKLVRFRSA